jgi:hypothetical protein
MAEWYEKRGRSGLPLLPPCLLAMWKRHSCDDPFAQADCKRVVRDTYVMQRLRLCKQLHEDRTLESFVLDGVEKMLEADGPPPEEAFRLLERRLDQLAANEERHTTTSKEPRPTTKHFTPTGAGVVTASAPQLAPENLVTETLIAKLGGAKS